MREFIDVIKQFSEDRKDHPNVSYEDKMVKGAINKVIAVLSADTSGTWTRLAKRFGRIKRIQEMVTNEANNLNAAVKAQFAEIFDAQDEIYTRVIDTVSLTITLAKKETKDKFDAPGFEKARDEFIPQGAKDLAAERDARMTELQAEYAKKIEKLFPELEAGLLKLRAAYTTAETISPKLLQPKLKDGSEITTEAMGNIMMHVKTYAQSFANYIRSLFVDWDTKYAKLKEEISQL